MSEYMSTAAWILLALFCVAAIFQLTGLNDSFKEAMTQPSEVSAQKLEDLCISGNANACKMYEIRYEKRCLL